MKKKREKVNESLNMIMFAVVLTIISISFYLVGQLSDAKVIQVSATALNIMLSVASIFTLIASILEIVDSITMRKVNKFFKFAFISAIAGLVLSAIASGTAFLPENLNFIYEIIEIVALVFETAVFYFYIAGIRKVHQNEHNSQMAHFGKFLCRGYILSNILFYILTIVATIVAETNSTLSTSMICFAFAFALIGYTICFVFLKKSRKPIATN